MPAARFGTVDSAKNALTSGFLMLIEFVFQLMINAGYDLANGNCAYSPSNTAPPVDGGCKLWDATNSRCSECSPRWVANANGLCVKVSDNCR